MYPWIPETIERYESLDTKEARFIKILDKSMTKITNILNKGEALRKLAVSREEIIQHFGLQTKEFKSKYSEEFPELIAITEELMERMLEKTTV